jgi:hypothetical protein
LPGGHCKRDIFIGNVGRHNRKTVHQVQALNAIDWRVNDGNSVHRTASADPGVGGRKYAQTVTHSMRVLMDRLGCSSPSLSPPGQILAWGASKPPSWRKRAQWTGDADGADRRPDQDVSDLPAVVARGKKREQKLGMTW